jgi:myosin protein heavy chain
VFSTTPRLLETVKLNNVGTDKMFSDRELQRLQLQKQDLERSVEEQADRVSNTTERTKKAESHTGECPVELGKV